MKLEELKKRIDFCLQKLGNICPKLEIRYVDYEKISVEREVYHVQIDYELKLSTNQKIKLFLKEASPHIGFDFDLDYYDNETIQNCIAKVFSQAADYFVYVERNLPSIVRKLEFK